MFKTIKSLINKFNTTKTRTLDQGTIDNKEENFKRDYEFIKVQKGLKVTYVIRVTDNDYDDGITQCENRYSALDYSCAKACWNHRRQSFTN